MSATLRPPAGTAAPSPGTHTSGLQLRPTSPQPQPLTAVLGPVPGGRWASPVPVATAVTGVTLDSRAVRPGDLYAALPGARTHGAQHAAQAASAGAVAVLTDDAGAARAQATGLPVFVAPDPRGALGDVAVRAYGDPAKDLALVGVTGTNGKTTVAYLLDAGLRAAGHRTGLLGTIETRIADAVVPSVRTTPEAPDLQALFAVMAERGVTAAAMEVSSHALALGRVDGCHFSTSVFTNLSQDHLDFHGTMADYFAAKAALFTPERSAAAVIDIDDEAGRRLAAGALIPVTTVSSAGRPEADWRAEHVVAGPAGSSFGLHGPDGIDLAARVQLVGSYNVANALLAVAALVDVGIDPAVAVAGVGDLAGVPGRMERVDAGQPFLAVVDYAHSPDAVRSLLETVRAATPGRVVIVLGCGGDRDRGKRPLMGRAAAAGADLAVLTSDNPRSEDPQVILEQVAAGARSQPGDAGPGGEVAVEPDRAAAISLAVRGLGVGDAVVVAGKGHEAGQEIDGTVTPFDDREVLRAAIGKAGTWSR